MVVKDVSKRIKAEINGINKMVLRLKGDDLNKLSKTLQDIRRATGEFERYVERMARESEAEKKVKAIIEAGYKIDEITIDRVHFYTDEKGNVQQGYFEMKGTIPF